MPRLREKEEKIIRRPPSENHVRYQIWYKDGNYAMVSGKHCNEPILSRMSTLVHEFFAKNKWDAEHTKKQFVKLHKQNGLFKPL